MASLVQSTILSVAASSCALAYTANVNAGSLLTAEVADYTAGTAASVTVSALTKSAGTATLGTIVLDVTNAQAQAGNCGNGSIFSVPVLTSGSCTLSFSLAAASFITMTISEWSGLTTNAKEASNSGTSATNDASGTSGNASSAQTALFVGMLANCVHSNLTLTPPSGWVLNRKQDQGASWVPEGSAYQIVGRPTTSASAWSWTGGTGPWVCCVAVYPAIPDVVLTAPRFARSPNLHPLLRRRLRPSAADPLSSLVLSPPYVDSTAINHPRSPFGWSPMRGPALRRPRLRASAPVTDVSTSVLQAVTMAATAVGTAVLSELMQYQRTLAATAVGVSALTNLKTFFRTLSATAVGVVAQTKLIPKTLAATAVGVASMVQGKLLSVTMAATAVGVAALSKTLTYARTLAATAVGVAALSKVPTYVRTLSATAVGTVSLTKKMFVTLTALASGVAAQVKKLFVTLTASSVGQTVLTVGKLFNQTMSAVAIGIAGLVTQFIAGVDPSFLREIIHYFRRRRWR
jgi:hypothetical protein